jgi:hypothetical protein
VLVLLAATAAAFAVAQRLKLERAPVTQPRFTRVFGPACECPKATARLVVRLREPETVTASIVTLGGDHVRTLERELRLPRGRARFRWDGRDDDGEVVREGRYRLKLELRRSDRTIVVPTPVRVDTTPPRVELVEARPRSISPDGDGRADRVRYTYRSSEFGYPLVYVDGEIAARGRHWPAGVGRAQWRALVEGGGSRPVGYYRTHVRVTDPAGNESAPTEEVGVRVRFVEIGGVALPFRAGGVLRFRIDADAKTVSWRLARGGARDTVSAGELQPGRVSISLAGVSPGEYILSVRANGRVGRASVTIVR